MRINAWSLVLSSTLTASTVWAQEAEPPLEVLPAPGPASLVALTSEPPAVAEVSLLAGNEFAALLSDQMPSTYDLLQATIVVEDKAAQVTWAPFLAMTEYHEILSETRLQIGQKDGRTNLGLVLRWNPLSPRARRGREAWAGTKAASYGDEFAKLRGLRWEALRQQDTLLALEKPEILVTRQTVEQLTPASQDLSLSEEERKAIETKLEGATKKLATLREEARIVRADRLLRKIQELRKKLETTTDLVERAALIIEIDEKFAEVSAGSWTLAVIDAELAATEKALAKKGAGTVAAFEQNLFTRPVPVISLSYTATLFPALGGSFVDADADGLDDNAHTLAGRSVLLSGLLRMGPKNQLSLAAGRSWKRSSAEAGMGLAESDSYGATYARRLKVLDPEYQRSDEYLSSLFVPSVVGGLSVELSDCRSPVADCQDKAEEILAVTPFVDVKLKKAIQFRLGVTWKEFSGSDIADEQLGVVSLIGLQLGLPN